MKEEVLVGWGGRWVGRWVNVVEMENGCGINIFKVCM